MFTVGLTGGIGSGKSVVARRFADLGVPVIDADLVAREVVEPGQPALAEITARFGSQLLDDEGKLRRKALREIVFNDNKAREDLEAILHPRIRQRMQQKLESLSAPYTILAIPLLVETAQQDRVDRVLVVDCAVDEQIRRVSQRDGITSEQARAILDTQATREQRLGVADDIIDNSGTIEDLDASVLALHRQYLALSENASQY
ncbi:MAG: dephospho-CoA kinase [Sedimenticola sp.]